MPKPIPLKGGDEQDALTKTRHCYRWRPGERKRVKRKYNKRVRQFAKHEERHDENNRMP